MKKKFVTLPIILLCVFVFGGLAACAQNRYNTEIEVLMVDGATVLPLTKMQYRNFDINRGYNVSYTLVNSPDALIAALLRGEPDFAIAPINVAAAMHANGSGYRLAAVTTWGLQHIVSSESIDSLNDLIGETLFAFGRGAIPGITLRAILNKNEIPFYEPVGLNFIPNRERINIIYLASQIDVRNAITLGILDGIPVRHAMLAEPVVTATQMATAQNVVSFSARIDLQAEWAVHNAGQTYPQSALIFHERLLGEAHGEFLEQFIAMAHLSSLYAIHHPLTVGDWARELGSVAIPGGTVVSRAASEGRLPLDFLRALDAKSSINTFLEVLYNEAPALIGGRMPQDYFFHI